MQRQDFYRWFKENLRGKKGQQGFTLIELLVVVTILGVLAGIVTLSLVGLTTNSSVQACNSEYKTVQAALDAFMAANNVDTINSAGPTKNMGVTLMTVPPVPPATTGTPLALYNPNPGPTSPNFTRNGTTQFSYTWDTHGKITAISGPTGCNVL
jgi:prepilin-type N-terminal cleavage/methylation domain-containing protein